MAVVMRRFLIEASPAQDGYLTLSDSAEIHHIKNVLRLNPGAEVLLSDGGGTEYAARLVGYVEAGGETSARFEVLYTQTAENEPEAKVTLFQCLPKHGKMEQIIQKSVELGAAAIVPVSSDHSVPKLPHVQSKISRWQRVAEEACKQSRRGVIPMVSDCIYILDICEVASQYDLLLLPYENEYGVSIKKLLSAANNVTNLALIIGSEGGFSANEVQMLREAGAQTCSLGKTILRTETAGPAALAMIMYELELMG